MRIANDYVFNATEMPEDENIESQPIPLNHSGGFSVQLQYAGDIIPAVAATLANQTLVYTAVDAGAAGNDITIALIDPAGNDQTLSINVTTTDIVVNLATGPAGAITTTRAQLVAALLADSDVTDLITVSGSGATAMTALAETPLAGGADQSQELIDGVFKLQASCDDYPHDILQNPVTLTNWNDIEDQSLTVNGLASGSLYFNVPNFFSYWGKVVFIADVGGSGPGTVTGRFNSKGF